MEEKKARIRINFSAHEIELEGSETFISEYLDKFEDVIESFKGKPIKKTKKEDETPLGKVKQVIKDVPKEFGEYLQRFPKVSKEKRMLIAAYFDQKHSDDNTFETAKASSLLEEQGIKVTNPAQAISRHKGKKRLYVVLGSKFRVSEDGEEFIQKLMSEDKP